MKGNATPKKGVWGTYHRENLHLRVRSRSSIGRDLLALDLSKRDL
jgi:hypothetical protein